MDAVLDFVTRVMVVLGDVGFGLLSFCSPAAALWIISAVTGVLMLVIWRYTSNQEAIADVRRKISANLLASKLLKDYLSVTFRAQRQIIFQALRLLVCSVRPMLIMSIPFVLIMVQIGLRYQYRPMAAGERVGVTVTLRPDVDFTGPESVIELPPGIATDANDPCRAVGLRTVDWRITAASSGTHELTFGTGDDRVRVPLSIGDGFERVSAISGGGFWDRLLYSSEPSFPASSIFESVKVHYPARSTPICGWDIHWLITLLILSIVFALVFKVILKPFFKVHI